MEWKMEVEKKSQVTLEGFDWRFENPAGTNRYIENTSRYIAIQVRFFFLFFYFYLYIYWSIPVAVWIGTPMYQPVWTGTGRYFEPCA